MAANDWFCQFLADILAAPVERPLMLEATAQGAAFLAGLQLGIFTISPPSPPHGSLGQDLNRAWTAPNGSLDQGMAGCGWPDAELALWQFRPEGIHDLNDPQETKEQKKKPGQRTKKWKTIEQRNNAKMEITMNTPTTAAMAR